MKTKAYLVQVSQKLFTRFSLIFIFMVLVSMVVSAYIFIKNEEQRALKDLEISALQLAKTVGLSSKNAILKADYAFLVDLHTMIVNEFKDIAYSVVMNKEGIAIIHSDKDYEGKFLSDDISKTAFASAKVLVQRYYDRALKDNIMEVSTPTFIGEEKWGTIRLGFLLSPLKHKFQGLFEKVLVMALAVLVWGVIVLLILLFIIKRPVSELEELSKVDGLTELLNHTAFQKILDIEIDRAKEKNSPLGLLMMDVDNFKKFNDTFGHTVGDAVLKKVSKVLKGAIRKSDAVARYGGEEFAVILPDCNQEDALKIAETIRKKIAQPGSSFLGSLSAQKVTISIGLCIFPQIAKDKADLVSRADSALYEAKKQGKNITVIAKGTE